MAITAEQKEILRDTYLEDELTTLNSVANISESIIGVKVTYNALKLISMSEGWGVEKRRRQFGKPDKPSGIEDQADDIQRIVYAQIMDPDAELTPNDLASLIRTWDTIRAVVPRRRSGKSSRQQQIEATRIAMGELAKFRNDRKEGHGITRKDDS